MEKKMLMVENTGHRIQGGAVSRQEQVRCLNAEPGKLVGNSNPPRWWVAQGAQGVCGEEGRVWMIYFAILATNHR